MRSGMNISVTIDDKKFKRTVRRLILKGKDLRPALKQSGVHMIGSFAANFKAKGRPMKWPQLSANTVAGRRKFSSQPLMDSGRLRISAISGPGKGSVYELNKNSLRMGSSMFYAKFQQEGTNPFSITAHGYALRFPTLDSGMIYRPSVSHPGIPARPFILFQTEDVRTITKIFASYLVS